jgi:chemotaxis protein CheD
MRRTVGVAQMAISGVPGDVLVTHALGSCLGITIYDPTIGLAGLLHVMLPLSNIDRAKAEANPAMFVDTGVPLLLGAAYAAGARRQRLIVKVAGGASRRELTTGPLAIGKRNVIVLKRLLWKNGIFIAAEEVGGVEARGMSIDVDSGTVQLFAAGTPPRIL